MLFFELTEPFLTQIEQFSNFLSENRKEKENLNGCSSVNLQDIELYFCANTSIFSQSVSLTQYVDLSVCLFQLAP